MPPLYRLDAAAAAIARAFAAHAGDDPWAGGYATPGKFAPVITAGREFIAGARPEGHLARGPRRMVPRLWGVPPPPAAQDPARLVASVRNADSPFWIGNLRNSEFRCLVPATGFMLWGRVDPATNKRRSHWLGCTDQPVFGMAGVWKDSEVPGFALLACPANALVKSLGAAAMPVILPANGPEQDLWLHGGWDRAGRLLEPYASSLMAEQAMPTE